MAINVQERTHNRSILWIVCKQRGQLQMHASGSKRRYQRANHLLRQCSWLGLLFIAHAVKSVTHAHIEFSRPPNFQSQMMKGAPTSPRIECRLVRSIADEIVTALVLDHSPDALTEIVRILDGHAAGFSCQIVQAFLSFKSSVTTTCHRVHHLLRVTTR